MNSAMCLIIILFCGYLKIQNEKQRKRNEKLRREIDELRLRVFPLDIIYHNKENE